MEREREGGREGGREGRRERERECDIITLLMKGFIHNIENTVTAYIFMFIRPDVPL